jgi:predicted DNA-binding WGR domain protein
MATTRLEFHSNKTNSHKYYEFIKVGRKLGMVMTRWGRCGWAANKVGGSEDIVNGERLLTEREADILLDKKLRKGYEPVSA